MSDALIIMLFGQTTTAIGATDLLCPSVV